MRGLRSAQDENELRYRGEFHLTWLPDGVWHGETFAGFAGAFVLLEGRRELEQTGIDSLFREKFTSSFRQEIGVSAILKSVRANSQLPTNVSRYRAAQAHWIASKASGADHASKLLFSIVRLVLRRPAVATSLEIVDADRLNSRPIARQLAPPASPREIDSRSSVDRHSARRVLVRDMMPPRYRRYEKRSREAWQRRVQWSSSGSLAPQIPDPRLPLCGHGTVNTDHCTPLLIRLSRGCCTDRLNSQHQDIPQCSMSFT